MSRSKSTASAFCKTRWSKASTGLARQDRCFSIHCGPKIGLFAPYRSCARVSKRASPASRHSNAWRRSSFAPGSATRRLPGGSGSMSPMWRIRSPRSWRNWVYRTGLPLRPSSRNRSETEVRRRLAKRAAAVRDSLGQWFTPIGELENGSGVKEFCVGKTLRT